MVSNVQIVFELREAKFNYQLILIKENWQPIQIRSPTRSYHPAMKSLLPFEVHALGKKSFQEKSRGVQLVEGVRRRVMT